MDRTGEHTFVSYLAVSLWISSMELAPDKITQIVGIEPSYVRVRDSLIPGCGMSRRPEFNLHEWQFRKQLDLNLDNLASGDSEEFITGFLEEIKNSAPQIRELSDGHNVMVSFVYHVNELPYIGLTRQQVSAIAALGAKLDYDLMVEGAISDGTDGDSHLAGVE